MTGSSLIPACGAKNRETKSYVESSDLDVRMTPRASVLLSRAKSGLAVRTVAAESVAIPGVNILTPLTDAWFEPLAARQRVAASRFHARATENDILMDVAVLHLELIGNQALLEANCLSESQAYELVRVTAAYAAAGQGRQADAYRARSEWGYRRADVQKAEEHLGVTVARLANRLNLSLHTIETHRWRIMEKLDLHSTAELVLSAVRRGVVS